MSTYLINLKSRPWYILWDVSYNKSVHRSQHIKQTHSNPDKTLNKISKTISMILSKMCWYIKILIWRRSKQAGWAFKNLPCLNNNGGIINKGHIKSNSSGKLYQNQFLSVKEKSDIWIKISLNLILSISVKVDDMVCPVFKFKSPVPNDISYVNQHKHILIFSSKQNKWAKGLQRANWVGRLFVPTWYFKI